MSLINQSIATQHSTWNRKYGKPTQKQTLLDFPQWFLQGIRNFEAKGAEFELFPDGVKITRLGKPTIFRTIEDFRQEYETEYLSKFSGAQEVSA